MAKLDNIKVVNENTVEYNGFVYTLVTGDAKVDDIVKASEQEHDVTEGAFYLVVDIDYDNDIVFKDNVDDSNCFNQGEHSVFRKSHPITNDKLTDVEGVVIITLPDGTKLEGTPSDLASVTRSMQVLQNEQQGQVEQVASVEMTEEAVEEGQSAPLQLQAGDYGKVVEKYNMFLPGDIVKVLRNDGSRVPYYAKRLSGGEEKWLLEKQLVRATEAEVKAVTEPRVELLKVGDYAKVIQEGHGNFGKVVKITNDNRDGQLYPYATELLDGTFGDIHSENHLVKATDEEVQMAMLEAKQALLKEGDFARVISNEATTEACGPHEFEVGTVLKLHEFDSDDNTFETRHLNGDEPDAPWVHRKDLEPLTKEEAEHIAREAEEEKKAKAEHAKWSAIGREVGEIKKGDIVLTVNYGIVEITSINDGHFRYSYDNKNGDRDRLSKDATLELIVPVEQRFDTVG
ncbi:hypothetical protein [Bacillus thuringiensis]|uniref:hypothetical protein n=1 Tax=Bacillus thuringiensis TaxID=1428 RepID=UPI000BFB6D2F|nr:hypothetical protein [Bacillus thuringiensis]PGY46874.1 hypothetical protein COE09_23075 [Bacillus thuringiensis]